MSRPTYLLKDNTLYWMIRTYNASGILTDADSVPSVNIYKNGVDTADTGVVTKRGSSTGIYDCYYNPSGEIEGDQYGIEETVVISSQSYENDWACTIFDNDVNIEEVEGSPSTLANFADAFDGTGYTDDFAPATQAQVSAISATSSAGFPNAPIGDNTSTAIKGISFVGVETTGDYTSVDGDDGNYHQIDDDSNAIDIVYEYSITGGRLALEVAFKGFLNGGNDDINVMAYDFVGTTWDTIGTISGKNGTTDDTETYPLLAKHTGTGSDIGSVLIRFQCTGQSNPDLNINRVLVNAANLSQTVGYALGRIWLNTLNGQDAQVPFVDGTADNPCQTLSNFFAIQSSVPLYAMDVSVGSTLDSTVDINNINVFGQGYTINLNGRDYAGTNFHGAHSVSGTGFSANNSDFISFYDCIIDDIQVDNVKMSACSLQGTITCCSGGGTLRILRSQSIIAGTGTPILDFGTSSSIGHNVTFADYQNGLRIVNFNNSGNDRLSLSGKGQLQIAGSCSGTINLRGIWRITDESNGNVTILRDDLNQKVNDLYMSHTTIATLASQTSFTLTNGSSQDDAYNNSMVVIEDAEDPTLKAVGYVLDYTGSSKTVTLSYDPGVFSIVAGDKICILPFDNRLTTAAESAEISANQLQT